MEGPGAAPVKERRRDRRLPLGGRLGVTRPSLGLLQQGRVLDVSAGGVRACFQSRPAFRRGQAIRFELAVGDERKDRRGGPPAIRLEGQGTVLRVEHDGERGQLVAVRFQAPLSLLEETISSAWRTSLR
jgi:hypothetical protein